MRSFFIFVAIVAGAISCGFSNAQELSPAGGGSYNDTWNKARDEAVQFYLPFAPDAENESRKLQFLCDVIQREVNGLREVAHADTSDKPTAQSPSPVATPP